MSQPPNQPYSGQPFPEQPGQQPGYPGQPYPGQPGYPGLPYQGQPNPDVPSSVPPQPGYPPQPAYVQQPSYPQPEYTQPGYAQPGYTQPDYGYPQSGPPMQGYPPAPKQKSKALPITLVSIAVVLVLCVGGGTAIYLAGRNTADKVAEALTTPSAPVTGTQPTEDATTEPPAATITVVEPKTLGGRPKLTDPQFAGAVDQLDEGLTKVPNATETVGVLYGTPEKQDIVIVAAAAAPVGDPKRELDATFLGAGVGGLKITGITRADPGSLGGEAKCGKGEAGGARLIMCGWADEGSVGFLIWYFKSMSKAKAEFPKLRAQVEKKSN